MSHPHTAHELQEGIGQTGRFGEVFVVLGTLILVGGAVLWALGSFGAFHDPNLPAGGAADAVQVGALFLFEGLGFTAFGVMVMVTGWVRNHDAS